MNTEQLMAVILEEIDRQHQKHRDGPYTFNHFGDEIGVDGTLRLRELAEAVLRAIEAK